MRFIIMIIVFLLSSCSYLSSHSMIQNRNKHYLTAKSIPPLRIPPGVSSDAFHNTYPVSDREYPIDAKDVNIAPPGLIVK